MKLIIDIPMTEKEIRAEIDRQIEEFERTGLLPVKENRDETTN